MTDRLADGDDDLEARFKSDLSRSERIWNQNRTRTSSDGSTIVVIHSSLWLSWPVIAAVPAWLLVSISTSGSGQVGARMAGVAFMAFLIVFFARLGVHCRVVVRSDGIAMIDFIGQRLFKWDEIESASAGYYGLIIRSKSGSTTSARFVAATSNVLRSIGGTTGADRIANWIAELVSLEPEGRATRLKAGIP